MDKQKLKEILWRIMKQELCLLKDKAKCVVLLYEDVQKVVNIMVEDEEFKKL